MPTPPTPKSHAERNAEYAVGRKVRWSLSAGEDDSVGVGEIVASWIDGPIPQRHGPPEFRLWIFVIWELSLERRPCVLDPENRGGPALLLVPEPEGT